MAVSSGGSKTPDKRAYSRLFPPRTSSRPQLRNRYSPTGRGYLHIRDTALLSLEGARRDKRIGKALDAKLILELSGQSWRFAQRYQPSLKELLNVSQVEIVSSQY